MNTWTSLQPKPYWIKTQIGLVLFSPRKSSVASHHLHNDIYTPSTCHNLASTYSQNPGQIPDPLYFFRTISPSSWAHSACSFFWTILPCLEMTFFLLAHRCPSDFSGIDFYLFSPQLTVRHTLHLTNSEAEVCRRHVRLVNNSVAGPRARARGNEVRSAFLTSKPRTWIHRIILCL